ncbi:MAG: hypothetical protein ACE5OY_04765 [Candidatus Bathyarchaeia archaeon]
MIPLELLRGFLYVIALLPIVATLKLPKRTVFLSAVALLYVIGALVGFLTDPVSLPLFLKVVHGLEISPTPLYSEGSLSISLRESESSDWRNAG